MKALLVIPARMAATRLPGKPLIDIAGKPMILRMWELGVASGIKDVIVACDGNEIAEVITKAGGKAVITDPALPSGSDRVHAALTQYDPSGHFDAVINLQGDMPTFDSAIIPKVLEPLADPQVDIATLAAPITDPEEINTPAVVKPILSGKGPIYRALYFTRATAPSGEGPLYHHLGIYAYRPQALKRFVSLPPSPLELRERLEQLRALEAGMRIDCGIVDKTAIGVDTPEQLEQVRNVI